MDDRRAHAGNGGPPKPGAAVGVDEIVILADLRDSWHARRLSRTPTEGVRVLTYHCIVPAYSDPRLERNCISIDGFRAHVRILRQLRVIDLAELSDRLARGATRARGSTVAITFDDGYAGSTEAAAILQEARLPWTLFVSTGPVEARSTIWTVELSLLLLHGRATTVELFETTWPLTSRIQRVEAFQSIRERFKGAAAAVRRRELESLRQQEPAGELDLLFERFPSFRSISWSAIAELASAGVEIGSHGVHHELHHALQPEPVRREEMVASKSSLETHIVGPCRYFSFPNGATMATSALEAERAGFRLAFTTEARTACAGDDRFALPRVEAGASLAGLLERLSDRIPEVGATGGRDETN